MAEDRTNQDFVDRFTLVHLAAGAGAARLGVPWQFTLVGSVGFEILEQQLKRTNPEAFPNPSQDSFANALVDIAAAGVGAYAVHRHMKARKKRKRKSRKK